MVKDKPLSKQTTTSRISVSLTDYAEFIIHLKSKIRLAQLKAAVSVNREMILLYWEIGRDIVEKQGKDGWGSNVIERCSRDLRNEFPGIAGFSSRNVWRMRAFYNAYKDISTILPQPVAELDERGLPLCLQNIPWSHNVILLEKLEPVQERLWYAQLIVSEGLSRDGLVNAIKTNLYKRYGKAVTNFQLRLPERQSGLAQECLRDPYLFDFLELGDDHSERDLDQGLISHVEKFMRELGQGFSFVGRQVHLQVSDKDFYLDLLFYHLKLRCFVVIELKAVDFKPEHAGKMNFYLSAVDSIMKHPTDNPTIGLLICKKKDNFIAEYALRDINKPLGVAEYETQIVSSLPKKFEGSLPTIEAIEAELSALPKAKIKQKQSKKQ
jgi:predicted nuclease of restriction endonuclease-like (RecB) superfamily